MDSRDLFQFRFVDRFDSKDAIIQFINSPSGGKALWLYGSRGTGKTRLLKKVLSENLSNDFRSIFLCFDTNSELAEFQQFLEKLQEIGTIRFIDFLRNNYISLLDISKQVTTQLLKSAGFDIDGFISAAYDGAKLFVAKDTRQQHSAVKVLELYVNTILLQHELIIVLDDFSSCKKQSVDLFIEFIGRFIENPRIHFLISTTDEDLRQREDIQIKLLTHIPVIRLELKPFDNDIYFYEILNDIFDVSPHERNTITQIFRICNGLPVKLQLALMDLYRENAIQLDENKARLNFAEMKRYLLQKEVRFTLSSYNISAKILLWLVIAFNEYATSQLLRHSAEYIIRKLFAGMELLAYDLENEWKRLFQGNILCIDITQKNVVKISNPFVRETLKEQFATDPSHRLFSRTLVSYFSDEIVFLSSLNLSADWKARTVVKHAIDARVSGWVQIALMHGLHQYSRGFVEEASQIFSELQQECDQISSSHLLEIANCFYLVGNYGTAESLMQIIQGRNDLNSWEFHFSYSKILNLLLKKTIAVQEAQTAVKQSETSEQRIRALNMQQQILVDITDGNEDARKIFCSITDQLKENSQISLYILPTLKTAVDFYHGAESFQYLKEAKDLAVHNNNQLELAFVLTNEGYEHFRQGEVLLAEQRFRESIKLLENTRIHETSYPLCDLANCYMAKGHYEHAIAALMKAALWNQSNYVFITIQTLLMVCYAFLGQNEKSIKIADDLVRYIDAFKITDTTMLRKIYLNMAFIYQRMEKADLEEKYAKMAYPISVHTSSWYRAYKMAQPYFENLSSPIAQCPAGEEWYWTDSKSEPWLVTFSHD